MQKKIIISLVLLQGCSMTTQTDTVVAGSINEITTIQEKKPVISTDSDTSKQGNQLMQQTLQQTLQQNQWQLVSYLTPQGMQIALPEHLATMLFSGRKISGSTGCNQYFVAYQLAEKNGLQFSRGGATLMACQGDIAQQEQLYLKNLAEIRFYQIQGEQLHLLNAEQQVHLIFRLMPALTLEETVWEVTGINNGHGGVVSNTLTNQAYLQFSEGKLQGGSGCNTLFANYQTEESKLSIGPLGSTRKFCAEEGLMTQEQQILQALTQVTRYEIRTNQLRLLNTKGSLMMRFNAKK